MFVWYIWEKGTSSRMACKHMLKSDLMFLYLVTGDCQSLPRSPGRWSGINSRWSLDHLGIWGNVSQACWHLCLAQHAAKHRPVISCSTAQAFVAHPDACPSAGVTGRLPFNPIEALLDTSANSLLSG